MKEVDSRDKVQHTERIDQLFLERMMNLAEQEFNNYTWRASTARTLNRDEVVKVWALVVVRIIFLSRNLAKLNNI